MSLFGHDQGARKGVRSDELCPHGPRCGAGHGVLGNPGPGGEVRCMYVGIPICPEAEDVHTEEPNLLAQTHE